MVTLENRQRTCLHIVDYVVQDSEDEDGEKVRVERCRIVLGDATDRDRLPEPGKLRFPGDERKVGAPGPVVQISDKDFNALAPETQQLISAYVQQRQITMMRGRAQ
ncbi:MAG: hypothetical protein AAGA48_27625 [Myxococcota bacterium]